MKEQIFRFCALMLIPLMAVLNCPVGPPSASADTQPVTTEIEHSPAEEAVAGKRITLEAEVTDEAGVKVVRVYFKASETAEYSFVELQAIDEETYSGVLPAPANGSGTIEYLILVQNGNNQVVKSQTYMVTVEDDDDAAAAVAENDPIQVYTELEQAPTEISGFSDNIVVDVVESAAKLGVVAGLYSMAAAGSSSSGAVAAGTVTASTGISTTAVVIGSVAAVAAVGGIAAAAGSGGSDDSGGGGSGTPTGREVVTWSEDVKWTGSYYLCDVLITVRNTNPGNVAVANASWGNSASATANSSGTATIVLGTVPHNPCLSGSVNVLIGGRVIHTFSSSCF